MKIVIIAAIASNGTIGRTTKPCETCDAAGEVIHRDAPDSPTWDDLVLCASCCGTCIVPANDIPWEGCYPEDMQHFREATTGHAVIAGRRTAESIGKHWPLKNRTCIEVTSHAIGLEGFFPNVKAESLKLALWAAHSLDTQERAYTIGGAQLYAAALPIADELDLTLIGREYEGDVKFPVSSALLGRGEVDRSFTSDGHGSFRCVERRPGEHPDLTFTRWKRVR